MSCLKKSALASALAIATWVAPSQRAEAQGHEQGLFVRSRILVKYKPGVDQAVSVRALSAVNARDMGEIRNTGVRVLGISASANERAVIAALRQRPDVEFAELDEAKAPGAAVTPNDPRYSSQWHLPKINAPNAWGVTGGSSSVTIAILDTGVEGTHPDLAAKMVAGWNFYDNNSNTADVYGHGTAVAGAAAAIGNNGNGVASPAWNCKLMPLRVGDLQGYATSSRVSSALTWAADRGARVANISYDFNNSSTVRSAAQYFMSKGGVVTMSAGNSAISKTDADNPYVLTVSATNSSDTICSWSNTGSNVDLSAPGESVLITSRGGAYGYWSGTSFSAPIVAGVAALVMSANPSLSGQQVYDLVKQGADDKGPGGWDSQYGAGRVNAGNAVALAGAPAPSDTLPPSVAITSPGNASSVAGSISVNTSASDNTAVASVTWSVDGNVVGSSSVSPYVLNWNSQGVANGSHTVTAVARDNAGNQSSAAISVLVNNPTVVDSQAPTAGISSVLMSSNSINITVRALDDRGVVAVKLYLDGKLQSTDTSSPWSFGINRRKISRGSHSIMVEAYDAAGNKGVSASASFVN